MPFLLKLTTSFAVVPGPISGVFLPSILKSCRTWPTFLKTNVTFPGRAIDFVERRKKNSPPLTWIVVAVACRRQWGQDQCAEREGRERGERLDDEWLHCKISFTEASTRSAGTAAS